MARFDQPKADETGWTDWIAPAPDVFYKMACCDCGLVHNMQFAAFQVQRNRKNGTFIFDTKALNPKKVRVMFKVARNNRSTAMMRRHEAKK